jgi:hypothetical protein
MAAITPMDEFTAINNKANSPVLQKRLQEGVPLLEETRRRDAAARHWRGAGRRRARR